MMASIGHSAALRGKAFSGHLAVLSLALVTAGTAFADEADDALLTVMNPTGIAPTIERHAMAPRPESLAGKTIYLVDVTFNGGDLFLEQMQLWLEANMPEVNTEFRIKQGYYAADDPELWREIQAVDGLMVMAIGH